MGNYIFHIHKEANEQKNPRTHHANRFDTEKNTRGKLMRKKEAEM